MGLKEVSTKEYEKVVKYAIENGLRLYAEGQAGIGKSAIAKAVSDTKERKVVDLRASTIDVGDLLMRIPNREQTAMVELTNQALQSEKPYTLLLDEFRHADASIRRMFYQILWDGKIGDYKLPDGIAILALSNPTSEVDTEDLELPLMDRFDIKLEVQFDFDEWKEWAFNNEIHPDVLAFLEQFNKEFMHSNFDGFPITPRTWERVSKHMDMSEYMLPPEASVQFREFRKRVGFFKEIDQYIEGKKPVPEEINMQYAFASAVMSRISKQKDDKIMRTWFIDKKAKGVHDEVQVYMNYALSNRHRAMLGCKNNMQYVLNVPEQLKKALISEWKEMGYIFDEKC